MGSFDELKTLGFLENSIVILPDFLRARFLRILCVTPLNPRETQSQKNGVRTSVYSVLQKIQFFFAGGKYRE